MSGRHAGAADKPVIAALKSARWLLAVIAVALVPLAVLALVICLIVFGTVLELLGASWLVAMTVLIQTFVRRQRGQAYLRWLMPGWLLAATWNVFTAFARHRGSPPGQMHSLTLAGYGVAAVSAALAVIALVIDFRSSGFGQRWAAGRSEGDLSH